MVISGKGILVWPKGKGMFTFGSGSGNGNGRVRGRLGPNDHCCLFSVVSTTLYDIYIYKILR